MKKVFEKIIEKLLDELVDCNPIDEYEKGKNCAVSEAIEIVKQEAAEYNNGWIPCSNRLPEVPEEIDDDECSEFIVTIKGANKATTLKCASDGTWFDDLGYTYDVIAWQPLPDPHQPKGE